MAIRLFDSELKVMEALWREGELSAGQLSKILQQEIGLVFMQVLEDAGVYKRTPEGQEAFARFLDTLR